MKIALVELSGSHGECLYSQVRFIKDAGHELTLVVSENLKAQALGFGSVGKIVSFKNDKSWSTAIKAWRYLRRENFDCIILNTAQGEIAKKLMILPYPKSVQILGTLHNLKKLESGLSQKIISRRVNHYFVLTEYLLEQIPSSITQRKSFSYYYSIYFPNFESPPIEKKPGEKWVVIPGQLERKRRDYDTLFDALKERSLGANIKFILLGKSMHKHGDGLWAKEKIQELGLESQFVLFEHFVSDEVFHHYARNADLILPLIHPGTSGFEMYLKNQISGAFNQAFAYKKPMLIEESFQGLTDFKESAFFYKTNEIINAIVRSLEAQTEGFYQSPKWTYEFQKENYLKHLES